MCRAKAPTALITAAALAVLAGGCCVRPSTHAKVVQEALAHRSEAEQLKKANEIQQDALAEKDEQIRVLQALGPKRLDKLFHVRRIELSRHTSGVNLDGKPGHDAIRVYLAPVDQHGSTIKAAGSVTIQLYDLAAKPKENLLGEYRWTVDEASKKWSSFFLQHYTFTCKWKAGPPRHDTVTVRVEFTDYLTGKPLTAQKVCTVQLPPKGKQPKTAAAGAAK